jgi:hypothetical protein
MLHFNAVLLVAHAPAAEHERVVVPAHVASLEGASYLGLQRPFIWAELTGDSAGLRSGSRHLRLQTLKDGQRAPQQVMWLPVTAHFSTLAASTRQRAMSYGGPMLSKSSAARRKRRDAGE